MDKNLVNTIEEMRDHYFGTDDDRYEKFEILLTAAKGVNGRSLEMAEWAESVDGLIDECDEAGLRILAAVIDDDVRNFSETVESAWKHEAVLEFGSLWLTSEGERWIDNEAERCEKKVTAAIEAEIDESSMIKKISVTPDVAVAEAVAEACRGRADIAKQIVDALNHLNR